MPEFVPESCSSIRLNGGRYGVVETRRYADGFGSRWSFWPPHPGSARSAQQPARGRPLAIEDYYRIQTVAAPVDLAERTLGRLRRLDADRGRQQHADRDVRGARRRVRQAGARRALRQGRRRAPSWTFDSRLEYAAERERWTVDPQNPSTSPRKAAALPAGAVVSADTKWIAFAKDKPQPKTERAYASEFEKRHEERFKGVTFDWKDFQRDGAPFPAPNLRARPAAQIVSSGRPAAAHGEGPRRHRPSPRRPRLASERTAARVHGGCRLARGAEVRQRDAVDGDDRRQGHAADRRRLRLRRRRFLARRQVTCPTRAASAPT